MKLEGKKINFLGDSITEGHGTSGGAARFTELLKQDLGLAESRNYGIGGTRIAPKKHRDNPVWDQDFLSRVAGMDTDADVVVVFGGTNDFGHGDAPLGAKDDRTAETFTGALHLLMRALIEKYPGKPIVFLTPTHRWNEDDPRGDSYGTPRQYFKAVADHPLVDYVDRIREVSQYYSLPVLDLWAVSGIQPAVPVIRETFMPDGLHPNDAGHRLLAVRIAAFLRAL